MLRGIGTDWTPSAYVSSMAAYLPKSAHTDIRALDTIHKEGSTEGGTKSPGQG